MGEAIAACKGLARGDEFEASWIGRLALGGAHPPSVLKIGLMVGFGGLMDGVGEQKFKHRDSVSGNF
jgi:hypothetical protein